MIAFLIVFLFLIFLTRFCKDHVSRRLIAFYIVYWGIAIFLCITGAYDIKVSGNTLTLVYVHLIAFLIGYSLFNNTIKNPYPCFNTEYLREQVDRFLKNPIVFGLVIVTTIYYVSLYSVFFARIQVLASAGDARAEFYSGELYGPIFYYLNPYLLTPLNNILLAVMVFRATYKRDFIFWVLVVNIIVFASLSGGRLEYFRIATGFLCVLYCIFDMIKNKKKLIALGVIGVALLFAMTSIASALRFGYTTLDATAWEVGVEVTEKHLQTYTAGPIAAFDYSLENKYVDQIGGYQNGKLTVSSIIRFVASPMRIIGVKIEDPVSKITPLKQDEHIVFGDAISFNALYTSLLVYYCDLGVFGVIFIPFILGLLYRRIIVLFYKKQTLPLLMLIVWLFYATIRSVMDYPFYTPSDIPLIIILLVLGSTGRNKNSV